jgi:hypothetical protein
MNVRRAIAALAAGAALAGGIVVTALPASAAPGDTTTTFSITAGVLSISVPASASLGSVAAGSASLSGPLGNVTVTDNRGGLLPLWTATVSSTDFTTGTADPAETVTKANVSYASGLATSTGLGAFTPQLGTALSTPKTAGNWVGVSGINTSTWNPTLTMTLQSGQVSGTYTGTINHSVL